MEKISLDCRKKRDEPKARRDNEEVHFYVSVSELSPAGDEPLEGNYCVGTVASPYVQYMSQWEALREADVHNLYGHQNIDGALISCHV